MKRSHVKKRMLGIAAALVIAVSAMAATAGTKATHTQDLNWRYYGNDLLNQRYQNVDEIDPSNVSRLQPAWVVHTGQIAGDESFEASPIEVDGTVYVPTGNDAVFALDASTGKQKWVYRPSDMPPLGKLAICCGHDNRGVAYGDGKIFLGRLDATLVALDAASGRKLWQATVAPWQKGYTITGAPQFAAGKVVIGISGGEYEIHGRVTAFDANSGKPAWRFDTIEASTWAGNSAKNGGVPAWGNPTVDPQLGLVYITTGNASPDFNGSHRAGNDLYASSDVALDLSSGKLRWYFQEVHHDIWDYDGPSPAILFTVNRNGRSIAALGHCAKSGQYFILDRRDGKPLFAVNETKVPQQPAWQHPSPTQPMSTVQALTPLGLQNEPKGYGYNYQPYFTPADYPMPVEQPGTEAGCEWPPTAFSPRTNDIYYGARYEPTGFRGKQSSIGHPGNTTKDTGSAFVRPLPGMKYWGYFGATNTRTGKIAWKTKLDEAPLTGPAVAGDLVFYGETDGKVHAADAETGKNLWTYDVPKQIKNAGGADGAFSVYERNGREYVVGVFGGSAMERHLDQKSPVGDAIVAFALPRRVASTSRNSSQP
ncbi:MAG: PQQ-binding-like beta-propeller repeat protein [Candidatus Eremiobacteraeota bacterium]|nr:PQQ-binding-like beta-propeller repeat protein [Candidatus Eremiobacteraeota bacterium]